MKPRGGGGPSWNPLPGPCGASWPWRSSKWRETLASVRVGRPPQLFAQWVGASEASRHRPSQPGNQALTRDPLCAPTQALLRDLVQRSQERRSGMPQGSCGWCSLPLGWGPLPGTAHGRRRAPPPHTHPPPQAGAQKPRRAGAWPGQSPPPPLGSRGWQTLSRHSSFSWHLSSAARVQERAGGSVGKGPLSAGLVECENHVLHGCLWTRPAAG